jgi:predicted helicase
MAKIFHASLQGLSQAKDQALLASDIGKTEWSDIDIEASEFYLLIPQSHDLRIEYNQGWKVTDIFPVNGVGMTTARDHVVIDFEKDPILERARIFRDSLESDREVCDQLFIPMKLGWNISRARQLIQAEDDLTQHLKTITYRPFDYRHIFYHDSLVWRTVRKVMFHMLAGSNLGLSICRQTISSSWQHGLVTDCITDDCYVSNKTRERSYLFPLYLYPTTAIEVKIGITRKPNISPAFLTKIKQNLGHAPAPEAIFNYIYAIVNSPIYRSRYAEFLKGDFPRIPITRDVNLFHRLSELGEQLVNLHLMKSPILNQTSSLFINNGGGCIVDAGHPKYEGGKVVINKQKDGFMDVPEAVWNFHVGGYQVCHKWLKDRKGRTLSQDDIGHYQKIVVALGQSIKLMDKIDAAIPNWPMDAEYN